ncbi:hypothetical protein D3C72_2489660 [compost metagenome]
MAERIDAIAFQRRDHSVGRADLGAVGRGIEGTVETIIGIHRVLLAEGTDSVDAAL